ncbi:MAG: hypothetical protein LBK75_03015 [Oscillospiraceae bacterium]|nr:hypothetical protein [Oscillospiraceae bacterium]
MGCVRAVIWAAGSPAAGASKTPLLLHEILFRPLLRWISEALHAAGVRTFCVVRAGDVWDDRLRACLPAQAGGAVLLDAGSETLRQDLLTFAFGDGDTVAVMRPLLTTAHAVEAMAAAHTGGGQLLTELLTDDEHRTGLYCFAGAAAGRLFAFLDDRFDFTLACLAMRERGLPLGEFFVSDGAGGAVCVTTPPELDAARRAMQRAVASRHMRGGVTILDPDHTYIDADTVIGRDTTILPGVILRDGCEIGEDCEIGPHTLLRASAVGDGCAVVASHVHESRLGRGVRVGPFAYLRPGSVVEDGGKVGDFVELKNAHVGAGSKIPHLSYIGDADVGAGVNIGCGSITVNYDGRVKRRTVVEDGAFIGCNTNLVAPVTVGQGAYTAAGSTVTDAVPPGALAIARARQENLAGWVARRRPPREET